VTHASGKRQWRASAINSLLECGSQISEAANNSATLIAASDHCLIRGTVILYSFSMIRLLKAQPSRFDISKRRRSAEQGGKHWPGHAKTAGLKVHQGVHIARF
jgi:hypothetical protein